ncbi:MAG: hypothetical protein ACLT3H_12590 [Roseburia sp.]
MKKKLMSVLVVGVMMISTVLIGCGSKGTTDLTGTWTSENNDGSYQEAVITENSIEINWVTDDGATKSVYWVGTYTAPTDPITEYAWTSERDKEKTDNALLASTDDTKDFSYKDGVLSYQVSAMGTTTTMELKRD